MGMEILAVRTRVHQAVIFRARHIVIFIHAATVEFDCERAAPIIINRRQI